MSVTGIGPVADGGTYGKWLGDIAGTSGIGPFASGDTYAQAIGGGAGTSGLQNFLNNLVSGGLDSPLSRFAGGIGALFSPDAGSSIAELQGMSKDTRKEIDKIYKQISKLTGTTPKKARKEAYDRFDTTTKDVTATGLGQLEGDYSIQKQYDTLGSRIEGIQQGNLNLANQLGGYRELSLRPPVVTMDVAAVRGASDWTAPDIARQYEQFTNYGGPQTSQFIGGIQRNTADAIGRYLNTSADVAGLMNYGTLA